MNPIQKLLGWILIEEGKAKKPRKYLIGKKEILAFLIFSPVFVWTFFLMVFITAKGMELIQSSWLMFVFFILFANPFMMIAWYFFLVLVQLYIISIIAIRILKARKKPVRFSKAT